MLRKAVKAVHRRKEKVDETGPFLIRKSKVDVRGCPRWKRSEVECRSHEEPAGADPRNFYASRLITCPSCKNQLEAARMQLFTPLGFRYVTCKNCATQSWSRGWLCECGVAWHNCEIHRVDPSNHTSTKPQKKSEGKTKEESHYKDSKRKAPDSAQSTTKRPLKRVRVKITAHSYGGGDADNDRSEAAPSTLAGKFLEKMRRK